MTSESSSSSSDSDSSNDTNNNLANSEELDKSVQSTLRKMAKHPDLMEACQSVELCKDL